jgi:activating signal cointegrator 1
MSTTQKMLSAPTKGVKVLSVQQPWADFIVFGSKWRENRSRRTNHRGELWIHASSKLDRYAIEFWKEEAGIDLFQESKGKLRTSAIIGRCSQIDCVDADALLAWHDGDKVPEVEHLAPALAAVPEGSWEFVEGPWCWILTEVQPCEPLTCHGSLGVWTLG